MDEGAIARGSLMTRRGMAGVAAGVAHLLALLFLCNVPAALGAEPDPAPVAIVGATLIHPEREAADARSPDTTIVIRGNRIESVGPGGSTPVPPISVTYCLPSSS